MATSHPILDRAARNCLELIQEHPFLRRCREGTIMMDELKEYLVQDGLQSAEFPRNVFALMTHLPRDLSTTALLNSLFDVRGVATETQVMPRDEACAAMLCQFGLSLQRASANAATKELIDAIHSRCLDSDPAQGTAALWLWVDVLMPTIHAHIIQGFARFGILDRSLSFLASPVHAGEAAAHELRALATRILDQDRNKSDVVLDACGAIVARTAAFFGALDTLAIRRPGVRRSVSATSDRRCASSSDWVANSIRHRLTQSALQVGCGSPVSALYSHQVLGSAS